MVTNEQRIDYFELEKLKQRIANTNDFDKEKFLELYNEKAFELFPIDKASPSFYERNQNIGPLMDWRLKTVLKMIPENKSFNAVNIGSGWEGHIEFECLKERPLVRFTAVDYIDPAIYKGPANVEYVKCDVLNLNGRFRKGQFDLIVCMEMMEHIPPTRTMKIWKQLKHVLKPGGMMIFTIPYTENLLKFSTYCPICCEWITESGHVREYPPSVVKAEMLVNNLVPLESVSGPNNMWAYSCGYTG